jgi:hypothetical protein
MGKSYLPSREEDLIAWIQNYLDLIQATPAAFGLQPGDATLIASLLATAIAALAAARNPSTATEVATAQKDAAFAAVISAVRNQVRRVQGTPTVTPAQKLSLGINVKSGPTPTPPPVTKPVLSAAKVNGRTVTMRMADQLTPTKRAKPSGVSEAEIFSFIGATPPTELHQWSYEGQASKSQFEVPFPPATPVGTQVWICARWCNRRGAPGPVSDAVSAYLSGGITSTTPTSTPEAA